MPSATVYFGSNEEALDKEAQKRLEAFHARIRQDEFMNYRLKIIGHTCPIDKERHNQRLSEKRAEAVRQWLVDHGYPSGDIQVKGMGDREPVSENGAEGKNRRAEIRIAGCILSDLRRYPKWKKGIDLLEQGDRHCENERYDEAATSFKEAEGLFAQVRLPDGRAAALGSLYLVYGRLKDTANADKYLNEFNSMMEKLPFDCSGSKD